MRNPLTPRPGEHRWDRAVFAFIIGAGVVVSVVLPGNAYRPWFALTAFILALTFVLVYSRRPWRSTYAGRAAMLSMSVTVVYTANVVAILWWPSDGYGYPWWEDITEVVYLGLAVAAAYKLWALVRPEPAGHHDPTTDHADSA